MASASGQLYLEYVGANIRRLRDRLGLTQLQLAEGADLNARYIQRLERGRINVGVLNLVAIAEVLGVKPGELLRQAELKEPVVGRPPKKPSDKKKTGG